MNGNKTYLIVKKVGDLPYYVDTIVDMVVILEDVKSLDEMILATHKEYENLRNQYPITDFKISEAYTDAFPALSEEARFLNSRQIKEKSASKTLYENEVIEIPN